MDIRASEENFRKQQYAEELKAQLNEERQRKNMRKYEDREKDIEQLNEFYGYNPFGRGGGGAPIRNQYGDVITTRKPQFRGEYERLHKYRPIQESVATRVKTRGGTSSMWFKCN